MTDADDPGPDDPGPDQDGFEQDGLEQAAAWIEAVTHDPMAGAVRGRLTVLSASEPAPRGRYQECRLELIAEAPGIPLTTVAHIAVFSRRRWPRAGVVVPALISPANPQVFDADWGAL